VALLAGLGGLMAGGLGGVVVMGLASAAAQRDDENGTR
jgi:hypothetical protein